MRIVLLGVLGVVAGLLAYQNAPIFNTARSYAETERKAVMLYRQSPSRVRRLIRTATQDCLEEHGGAAMPGYYADFVADIFIRMFKIIDANDYQSLDDPGLRSEVARLTKKAQSRAVGVMRRVSNERLVVQRSIQATIDWMNGDQSGLSRCVAAKVVTLAEKR